VYKSLFIFILSAMIPGAAAAEPKLEVLHEFTGPDGSDPTGGVVVDPKTGALYGTTNYGGSGNGTVFSLTPPRGGKGAWRPETLYAFKGGEDAATPSTGLFFIQRLNELIGTTGSISDPHCANQCGSLFELYSASNGEVVKRTIAVLHVAGVNLVPNSAPLVRGLDTIFGTAAGGAGAVYKVDLAPVHPELEILYDRDIVGGNFLGYHPQGVALDPSFRALYGTAVDDSGSIFGTVFQLTGHGTGRIVHGFSGPDGAFPLEPPTIDASGTIYGTTWEGGNPKDCPSSPGCGTVWKQARHSKAQVLHSFAFFTNPRDGQTPMSPLVRDDTTGHRLRRHRHPVRRQSRRLRHRLRGQQRRRRLSGALGVPEQRRRPEELRRQGLPGRAAGPAHAPRRRTLRHLVRRRQTVPGSALHRLRHGVEADPLKAPTPGAAPFVHNLPERALFGLKHGAQIPGRNTVRVEVCLNLRSPNQRRRFRSLLSTTKRSSS
jgi:hypothetical protein